MKALITGASGFIGSHLAQRLIDMGYEVHCLRREASDVRWLKGLNVNFVYGDCRDRASLEGRVRGYDYVFHLAGLIKANDEADFYTVNEKGTQNLIEAVDRNNHDIKRFVYLSSLSAYGPASGVEDLPSEDDRPHPVSHYGRSKLKGEEVVINYSSRIPVSILRPSVVYGPRDRQFCLFFRLINKGVVPYWGKGHTSLVYIDDMIDAIVLSVIKDEAIGKVYFISDGMVYSNDRIIEEIEEALGRRAIRLRLPRMLLRLIGIFGDRIGKITGKTSMINRDKIREIMYNDWVCDITRARRELGYNPKVGIREGMRWTADWYRIHGWI
jgi:nucleoside-diphosphate-sugar epimerase